MLRRAHPAPTAGRIAAICVLGLAAGFALAQAPRPDTAPEPRPVAAPPAAQPPAPAGPDLTTTYLGPVAKDNFAFRWKEKGGGFTRAVCRMNWEVPSTLWSSGGFDRNFPTYCAEALVGVVAGRTYPFQIQFPTAPEMYGLPDTPEGRAQAELRSKSIHELYGRYYTASLPDNDPDAPRAFQAALWEIIHESQLPEGQAAPFSLFSGNFQADYPALAQTPPFVQRAEQYLQSLTGNDNLFWQNLPGRELVRLRGLPGAAGEAAAQAQLALRYTRGGAAGYSGANALPGNGVGTGAIGPLAGNGFGGGGPGGYGAGGGGGGFQFIGTRGGGGPNTIVPNVPVGGTTSGGTPPSSTITPSVVPPVNASSSGTSSGGTTTSTTSSGSVTSTSTTSSGGAVPAPPGILLGAIVFGLLAGRRVLGQVKGGGKPQA